MTDREQDMEYGDDDRSAVDTALGRAFEPMPARARASVRGRLLAAIGPARLPFPVRALRAALAVGTGVSLLGGVSYAAAASVPGDLLYPVKRAAEQVYSAVRPGSAPASRETTTAPSDGPAGPHGKPGGSVLPMRPVNGTPTTRNLCKPPTGGPKAGRGNSATAPGHTEPKASKPPHGQGSGGSGGGSKTPHSTSSSQGVTHGGDDAGAGNGPDGGDRLKVKSRS